MAPAIDPHADCAANVYSDIAQKSGFTLDQVIGCGSFAVVFRGTSTQTGEEVAVKVEPASSKVPQLLYEAKVYKSLARRSDSQVPKVHWHGAVGNFNIMVMDLLGPSLEDVFASRGHKLSYAKTVRIGVQILNSVEYMHSRGFVHRDIKPENLVFKAGSLDKLCLIDFGMAKKYTDKTQDHIPFQTNKAFLGDSVFASIRAHSGLQQSRRDDLESVAYILLYLSLGFLPWAPLEPKHMKEIKESDDVEVICPKPIARLLRYSRDLSFEEAPDYRHLSKILIKPTKKKKEVTPTVYNFVPDWTVHHGEGRSPSKQSEQEFHSAISTR